MKKLLLALLILLIPIANAATITPTTITLKGNTTSVITGQFTIKLNNETCYPQITSDIPIYGLPSFNKATGTYNVSFLIYANDASPGTYNSTIKYCNAILKVNTIISYPSSINCPSYVKIYGEKSPGKTIKFDIRNQYYERVRNKDTVVTIESSDTGNTYEIDCPDGSCTWQIPNNEKGTLMLDVIVPKCNVISTQIQLKPAGKIEISVPNTIRIGEDFYIYVFDPTKGALPYVNVQIIAPNGQVFDGKTNENGVLYDTSLTKVYGKDIKPTITGTYRIYASLPGYDTVNMTFRVIKEQCPFQCCVNETGYINKPCSKGYACMNHTCVLLKKPSIKVICTKSVAGKETDCYLISNGKNVTETINATLYYDDKEQNITFQGGEFFYTFNKPGEFRIYVRSDKYEPYTYKGVVARPKINAGPFLLVMVVIIVVVFVYFIIKKGGLRKPKVAWNIEPGEEKGFLVEEE